MNKNTIRTFWKKNELTAELAHKILTAIMVVFPVFSRPRYNSQFSTK